MTLFQQSMELLPLIFVLVYVNKDLLSVVDYLFISDEDIDGDLSEYAEATKGWVLLHSSSGSTVSNGENEFFYVARRIDTE